MEPNQASSLSPTPTLSRPIVLRVFLPFAAGYFLSYLYRTINAVLAPPLASALQLDASDLGLLTSVYFLTFAAFQLPLGVLLDRFSPHKVESLLLLLASAGALLFALSDGLHDLVLGRALIGLGVSACLMASLKTFVLWFPSPRLPAVNGWILAAGGLGALTATAPVEWVMESASWRGVFAGLSVLTLLVSLILYLVVPERPVVAKAGGLKSQWHGIVEVYTSRVFWRLAPISLLSIAAHMAIQGLWAGPWLKDVAGLDRMAVADHLFWMAAGMVAGFLSIGTLAYRLSRLGIHPVAIAIAGMAIFIILQLVIALGYTGASLSIWACFGFFGTAGTLSYAILSQAFPPELAGRVNTALNLLVFVGAFVLQWGLGAVIGLWPGATGGYTPDGYGAAFGLVVILQFVALIWFWYAGPGREPDKVPAADGDGE